MSNVSAELSTPTLFIGLGGAGGEVLGRLRQLVHDEFGDDAGRGGTASSLQFLLLDTDDFEHLPPEVRKPLQREHDFVSLGHFNPRHYAESQLALHHSDLHRWFDTETLPIIEDTYLRDGAFRSRMLGRLCLHRYYHYVEDRIRAKIEQATYADLEASSAAQRLPLRVFIISGSCGGTGSAIFLDIACIVDRLARERGTIPSVMGVILLPFSFLELSSRVDLHLVSALRQNAWAFFDELNYILKYPSRLPELALDVDRRRTGELPDPADYAHAILRTVFLIDSDIPAVGRLELPGSYAATAQGIFHACLAFDDREYQSLDSNLDTKLRERDRIFGLPKRFACFGFSELHLHVDEWARGHVAATIDKEIGKIQDSAASPPVRDEWNTLRNRVREAIAHGVEFFSAESAPMLDGVILHRNINASTPVPKLGDTALSAFTEHVGHGIREHLWELSRSWRRATDLGVSLEPSMEEPITALTSYVERCLTRAWLDSPLSEVPRILADLWVLAGPLCSLDPSSVHHADRAVSVTALFTPEFVEFSGASGIPEHVIQLRSKRHRTGILRMWYAFSLYAVAGMQSLRRSYLERDRARSRPHIVKAWNDLETDHPPTVPQNNSGMSSELGIHWRDTLHIPWPLLEGKRLDEEAVWMARHATWSAARVDDPAPTESAIVAILDRLCSQQRSLNQRLQEHHDRLIDMLTVMGIADSNRLSTVLSGPERDNL